MPDITKTIMPTQAIESKRTLASDTEFLIAIEVSQSKILDLINTINIEIARDSIIKDANPDYTTLGSYSRKLATSADEEVSAMSGFREISDPANEARRNYYIDYLKALKPFAANLETGAVLSQKKDFTTALGFFSNAKNDLSLIRSQEIADHFQSISQTKENIGLFIGAIEQQANYTAKTS
jgi:hypothetical protein